MQILFDKASNICYYTAIERKKNINKLPNIAYGKHF